MTPYYDDGRVVLHVGHVLDVLGGLEAGSVQTCITSPPYWGLRSYGTEPQSWGGDPECPHNLVAAPGKVLTGGNGTASAKQVTNAGSQYGNLWEAAHPAGYRPSDTKPGNLQSEGTYGRERLGGHVCSGCGAYYGELGSEPTPELFVANLVTVFRGVKRVLRDDGTLWLNLGSSYSAGVTNLADALNSLLEGGAVFFGNAEAITVTPHRVRIATQDQRAPDGILAGLLATQRDAIENGHEDFGQVGNPLAGPGDAGLCPLIGDVVGDTANAQHVADSLNHPIVVGSELHAQPEAILSILRTPCRGARKDDETALPVNQANKPGETEYVRWHTTWETFARYALGKRGVDIDAVDDAVSFSNRLDTLAGLLADFRVTQASEQKLTLTSVCGRLSLTVADVGHLWFTLRSGSIVPYTTLYKDAIQRTNELAPKQDLCIPWRVAMALQRDGWILRAPIIWSKPNPMPESVTDRPTNATEMIFLFSKQASYFFDLDAVRGISDIRPSGVVETANLADKSVVLGSNLGLCAPPSTGAGSPSAVDHRWLCIQDAVGYATALLQGPELQREFGLPSLNAEVRQQLTDYAHRALISGAPVIHRPPVTSLRLADAYAAAEEFLQQLHSLGVTLANSDALRVGLRPPLMTDSPSVRTNADATVRVDDACEISQQQLSFHDTEYSTNGGTTPETGANMRNFWLLGPEPYPQAHFATFVSEIPRRAILAGTSARGQCPACGAPWERIVDGPKYEPPVVAVGVRQVDVSRGDKVRKLDGQKYNEQTAGRQTTGWMPSCPCSRTTSDIIAVENAIREWFGDESVYGLWANDASQVLAHGPDQVLLEDMRLSGMEGGQAESSNGVQEGEHTTLLPRRAVQRRSRIRLRSDYRSSDGEQERICTGAPASVGQGEWFGERAGRDDRPPHQRNTVGQSAREPDGDGKEASQPGPEHQAGAGPTPSSRGGTTASESPDAAYVIPYPPAPQVCLDPFAGSGTTLAVARWHQRRAVGIELNPEYARLIEQRLAQGVLL